MSFIRALRKRALLKGMLLTTPSCEMAEAVSHAGLDWAFIDLEHAPLAILDAQNLVRALGGRTAALIRVPDHSPAAIKKALDTGCDGIIVPQVETRAEAVAIVEAAKYAPKGHRSVGLARAHKYGIGFKDYLKTANDRIAVIVQIESKKAVGNLDGILSVPGIDAVFIGAYDLSASLNKPGRLDDLAVQAAIDTIFSKAKRAKMPVGVFSANADAARAAMEKGASLLAIGIDTVHMIEAARKIAALQKVRK